MSEQEFNSGHIIEALDRLDLVIDLIDKRILHHPAIKKADLYDSIDDVAQKLGDAYQVVGSLEDKA